MAAQPPCACGKRMPVRSCRGVRHCQLPLRSGHVGRHACVAAAGTTRAFLEPSRRSARAQAASGAELVAAAAPPPLGPGPGRTDARSLDSIAGLIGALAEPIASCCDALDVRVMPGKGRGVVATERLAEGALLLASPPLAIARGTTDGGSGAAQDDEEEPEPPTAADLAALLEGAALDEHQARLINNLYDGPSHRARSGSHAVLDEQEPVLQLPQLAAQPGRTLSSVGGCRGGGTGAASASGSSSSGGGGGAGHAPGAPPADEALLVAVAYNCYGEPAPDLLLPLLLTGAAHQGSSAAGALGLESAAAQQPFMGLWCDFAMLNHSCCPNTINYVVGAHDHMVVRTTERVEPGQELTVCYFGRELLSPHAVRTARTREVHAFDCRCQRCEHEAGLGSAANEALQELYDAVNGIIGPAFGQLAGALEQLAAAQAGPGGGAKRNKAAQQQQQQLLGVLRQLQRQLDDAVQSLAGRVGLTAAFLDSLELPPAEAARSSGSGGCNSSSSTTATASASSSQQEQQWLAACVYDAFELQLAMARLEEEFSSGNTMPGGRSLDAGLTRVQRCLSRCLAVVAAVAPGTTLHLQLAAECLSAGASDATLESGGGAAAKWKKTAVAAAEAAVTARYGPLTSQEVALLAQSLLQRNS